MARRRWSEGARVYAFTALILVALFGMEAARLRRAWQAHGAALAGPFMAATALAVATVATLWWLGRAFMSERSSPTWNLVRLGAVGLWSLGMFALFITTHRMRGVRLFYEAFDRPDTGVQVTAVAYQALVWAGMLAAMWVFARHWHRAGGFGADSPQHDPASDTPTSSR